MPLKTKTFRLDDTLVDALTQKATTLDVSESEIVRKALVCFLGIKFDNDCVSYDEFLTLKNRFEKLIQRLNIADI